MKKIIFVTATGLVCFFSSCKDTSTSATSSTTDSQSDRNKSISKEVYNSMETGDVSKLDSFIDKDIVDHGDMGDMKGIDTLKKMFSKMHTGYKDFKAEPIANATDGDYNFSYVHFSGTTTDASMGMPAGTHMDFSSIDLIKIKDGKATEHWAFMQGKDMMKMMSSDPTMKPCMDKMMMEMQNKMSGHPADNKMDTTKKM